MVFDSQQHKLQYNFPTIRFEDFDALNSKIRLSKDRYKALDDALPKEVIITSGRDGYQRNPKFRESWQTSYKTDEDGQVQTHHSYYKDKTISDAVLQDLTVAEVHSLRESCRNSLGSKQQDLKKHKQNVTFTVAALAGSVLTFAFGDKIGIPESLRYTLIAGAVGYLALLETKVGRYLPNTYNPNPFENRINRDKKAYLQADKLLFMKNEGQEFSRLYVQDNHKRKHYLTPQEEAVQTLDLTKKRQSEKEYEAVLSVVDRPYETTPETYKIEGRLMTEKISYLPETLTWAEQYKSTNKADFGNR